MGSWDGFDSRWLKEQQLKRKQSRGRSPRVPGARAHLQRDALRAPAELQEPQADKPEDGDAVRGEGREGTDAGDHRRTPAAVFVLLGLPNRRRRDLDGALATVMDCLVKAGLLTDDSIKHAAPVWIGWHLTPGRSLLDILIVEP